MRGRLWMVIGAVLGVALSIGQFPYLAGAARSLADTAEQLVGAGGHHLLTTATHGASRRSVLVATALVGVLLPGVTALLLVLAGRGTLRLRAIVGLLTLALSAASFAYHPPGVATGSLALALAVAGVAVAFSGPLVAAPLCALAGLLCGEWLPRILDTHSTLADAPVAAIHTAFTNHPGAPLALRVAVLAIAAIPFALAARFVVSR